MQAARREAIILLRITMVSPSTRAFTMRTFGLVLGACLTLGAFRPPLRSAEERPNILYIMADDHAAHAIGAYGSKINKTPNIDRLAQGGMRFSNCLVTNSICTPSRAAILTGKYCSHQRRAGVQSLRRQPADARQVPASRRLPHRHDRQMAPRQRLRPASTTGTSSPARAFITIRSSSLPMAARSTPATAPTSSPTCRWNSSTSGPRTSRSS